MVKQIIMKARQNSINYLWTLLIAILMIMISAFSFSIIRNTPINVIVFFTILYFTVGFLIGYFKENLLNYLWILTFFLGPNTLNISEFGLIGCLYWIWFMVLNLFLLDRGGHIGIEVKELRNDKNEET
jgi:hypothetical protein